MAIIKARTRGKQFVPHRTRLDRENVETLYAYAAFINEDVEYVINQVIETVLEKDKEFSAWRTGHPQSYAPVRPTPTSSAAKATAPSRRDSRLRISSSSSAAPSPEPSHAALDR